MYKKFIGVLLGLTLATCSLNPVTMAKDKQIRNCNYATQIIEEVRENNQLIAESMPNARPAGQYVFMAYLEVNLEILKDMQTWMNKNCKEA